MKNNGFLSSIMNSKLGKAGQAAGLALGIGAGTTGCDEHIHVGPTVVVETCGYNELEYYPREVHTYEVGCPTNLRNEFGQRLFNYTCVSGNTWIEDTCAGADIIEQDGYETSYTTWNSGCFVNHQADDFGRDICSPGLGL